jgi:hypothetical protein
LNCSTVDLGQYDVRRTVFISTLSTVARCERITGSQGCNALNASYIEPGRKSCSTCHREAFRALRPFFVSSRPGDEIGAMQRACIGSPTERPAATTYRDSRPGVGKATGTRYVRQRVTGSARHRGNCPSLALGPYSTDAGWRVETVNIPMSPCRRLDDTNYLNTGRKGEL